MARKTAEEKTDIRLKKLNVFVVRAREAKDVLPPSEPGDNNPTSLARRLLDLAFEELNS